ncbi:MAG: DivIVA domain-containing protein [Actinobacteria bacterium]|nr:DivIVA domain-containing protein [Actinomycetota bacterium]
MAPDVPERAPIDPDAVAQHAFTKGRKGYDTDEVRAYLVGLASEIRDQQRIHDDLSRRLTEVERRAADPKELDEEAVTQLLGEETARVLGDARKAATEIRTKAEDESKAVREAADAEAAEARASADQYAESVRTLADEGEARIRADAEAYAADLRTTAERETTEQRVDADAYATEVRDTADREVAEQRTAADLEVGNLTQQAESVLAERTAEAETAAAAIRAAAEEHDTTTRGAADEYAAATRATAEAEAERHVDDAREQGRAMVQEARDYRERVLADLADRRRAARDELERIGKTRDLLAVTLTDVVTQVERSHRALQDVAIDPGSVSDGGADRRFLDVDPSAVGLAVGEVSDGSVADDESVDAGTDDDLDDEPPVWSDDEPTDEASADDESVDAGTDDDAGDDGEGGGDPAAADLTDEDDIEALVDEPADSTVEEPEVEEGDADEVDADDGGIPEAADLTDDDDIDDLVAATADETHAEPTEADGEPGTPPGIDDLFARIRAERASGADEAASADVPAEGAEGEDAEVVERTDDEAVLDRRDAVTDEIERQLARRLKRVLSDEQNEALHDLRSVKGTPTAEEVLPSEDDHRARYRAALLEDLRAAERAGASFYGDAPDRVADVDDIADELSGDLVRQVRTRLERSFDGTDDPEEVADAIRALYREWKTQRIADAARHFVITAFSRGVAEAAPDGESFRWLVDHGGEAAPDCDDNALAGAVPKGEPFPTGDLVPPVHPGCRCVIVPVGD